MYEIPYERCIRKQTGVELYKYTFFFSNRGNTRSLHSFKIYN